LTEPWAAGKFRVVMAGDTRPWRTSADSQGDRGALGRREAGGRRSCAAAVQDSEGMRAHYMNASCR